MSSIRSRAPQASSDQVRRVMQANVGRETAVEHLVRSYLHRAGLRFRKDVRPLPDLRCKADIVFRKAKVCVFIDGCFWHGCPNHFRTPASNTAWWDEKINANRDRDKRNNELLKRAGWMVVRLWEHELSEEMLARLAAVIRPRKRS